MKGAIGERFVDKRPKMSGRLERDRSSCRVGFAEWEVLARAHPQLT
jgi:hypothetical protein